MPESTQELILSVQLVHEDYERVRDNNRILIDDGYRIRQWARDIRDETPEQLGPMERLNDGSEPSGGAHARNGRRVN